MIKSLLVYYFILFCILLVPKEYTKINNKFCQTNNICNFQQFTTVYY